MAPRRARRFHKPPRKASVILTAAKPPLAAASWSRLRSSPFARAVTVLSAGSVVGQAIAIALAPLLARLYTPEDFGRLAVFMGVAIIVSNVVTLRYETAVHLPKDDGEAAALLRLSIALTLPLTLLLAAIAALVAVLWPDQSAFLADSAWLALAVVAGGGAAVVGASSYWFNRREQFGRTTWIRIAQGTLVGVLPLVLYFTRIEHGLIIGYLAAQLLVSVWLVPELLRAGAGSSRPPLRQVARAHASAPRYLLITNLLGAASSQLPVFLIALWLAADVAGQFSLAWRVMAAPMALLGTAIGQVFFQRAAAYWPDRERTRSLLFKTWGMLAAIGALPTLAVLLFGEQLFTVVFGQPWAEAGAYASALALLVLGNFIASPTSNIHLVLGMQRVMPWFSLAQIIYRPLAIYVGAAAGDLRLGLWLWVACECALLIAYHSIPYKRLATP